VFCEGGVAVVKLDFKAVRMCSPASGDPPFKSNLIPSRGAASVARESYLFATV